MHVISYAKTKHFETRKTVRSHTIFTQHFELLSIRWVFKKVSAKLFISTKVAAAMFRETILQFKIRYILYF